MHELNEIFLMVRLLLNLLPRCIRCFTQGSVMMIFSETFSHSKSENWIIFSGFSQFALFVVAYDGIRNL